MVGWLVLVMGLFLSNPAGASGWNDYELSIGDGYSIIKANDLDIGLCYDGSVLIYGRDYPGFGPLTDYQMHTDHILVRHAGRTPRGNFPGDTFENVDPSQEHYFVYHKRTGAVDGPFDQTAFQNRLSELGVTETPWKQPHNPTPGRALAGSATFLLICAWLLFTHYWYITLPIAGLCIYGLVRLLTRRNRSEA